jgi:hypothetical protein
MADEEFPGAEYDELVADEDTDPDVFAESPTVPGGPRGRVANLAVDLVTTAERLNAVAEDWRSLAERLVEATRGDPPISPGNLASALYLMANALQESNGHVADLVTAMRGIAALLLDQHAKENIP